MTLNKMFWGLAVGGFLVLRFTPADEQSKQVDVTPVQPKTTVVSVKPLVSETVVEEPSIEVKEAPVNNPIITTEPEPVIEVNEVSVEPTPEPVVVDDGKSSARANGFAWVEKMGQRMRDGDWHGALAAQDSAHAAFRISDGLVADSDQVSEAKSKINRWEIEARTAIREIRDANADAVVASINPESRKETGAERGVRRYKASADAFYESGDIGRAADHYRIMLSDAKKAGDTSPQQYAEAALAVIEADKQRDREESDRRYEQHRIEAEAKKAAEQAERDERNRQRYLAEAAEELDHAIFYHNSADERLAAADRQRAAQDYRTAGINYRDASYDFKRAGDTAEAERIIAIEESLPNIVFFDGVEITPGRSQSVGNSYPGLFCYEIIRLHGVGNFNRSHPAYSNERDGDNDGIACEK